MHPYIPHLLADIETGERPDALPEVTAAQTFEEEMGRIRTGTCFK